MEPFIPVLLLAFLLVAPRRGGRPVGRAAKFAAVFVLVFGTAVIAFGTMLNTILER